MNIIYNPKKALLAIALLLTSNICYCQITFAIPFQIIVIENVNSEIQSGDTLIIKGLKQETSSDIELVVFNEKLNKQSILPYNTITLFRLDDPFSKIN